MRLGSFYWPRTLTNKPVTSCNFKPRGRFVLWNKTTTNNSSLFFHVRNEKILMRLDGKGKETRNEGKFMTERKEMERWILGAVLGNLFYSRDHFFLSPLSSLDDVNFIRKMSCKEKVDGIDFFSRNNLLNGTILIIIVKIVKILKILKILKTVLSY